ncbi:MAG TPA: oxidoreductase [Mycobacterium sp.]|nr:oxidoreductase [Mycobacterium sp.]
MSWTSADLPSFAGRSVIVTGANSGLGLVTARELARVEARVILACRDIDRGEAAASSMSGDVQVRRLDLQSLASVQDFADSVAVVDVLINNAGIMAVPYAVTRDGFESQIGVNHLGHFALTNLLLPRISDRVVTVSSMAHLAGRISLKDLNWKARPYSAWLAYGQSKLANLMFTYDLQRRLAAAKAKTIAVAAHPGVAATELVRHVPGAGLPGVSWLSGRLLNTSELGALPTLRAATDPAVRGGQYYGPDGFRELRGYPKLVTSSAQSHDTAVQERLWSVSEELTGVTYPV